MNKKILVSALASVFTIYMQSAVAQKSQKYCGSVEATNKMLKEHPHLIPGINQAKADLELHTQNYIANEQLNGSRAVTLYTIPVVFHIIHNYGSENISDAQVVDAVRILNEDYKKMNTDTSSVVSAFKSIIGDAQIQFRLAQKDPQGNCTNGITRDASLETYKGVNGWGSTSTSDVNRWPRNKYLNIWVVAAIESGAAGYTYLPSSLNNNSDMDGIIILHDYIGSIGTGSDQRSRALTHEIGHWLNLSHTWGGSNQPGCDGTTTNQNDPCYGEDNCTDDDGVTDTPNTIGYTTCNLSGASCGSAIDNVQNYMDYSYCSNMFTVGQASRMRAAITSSIAQRSSLWTTSNLTATGTSDGYSSLCSANFTASKTILCVGQTITFTDGSYNSPSSWTWSFPGAAVTSSTSQNPSVTYQTPGTYDVSLTVGNGSTTKSATKTAYITVLPSNGAALPFSEGFENGSSFTSNGWTIENPDDGITWQATNTAAATGTYSLKLNNYSNDSTKTDALVSGNIDLSGKDAITVSFKAAYAQKKAGNNDALKVYVSNNCGQTWTLRSSKSGTTLSGGAVKTTAYTPTSTQWQEFTITNITSAYMVSNFRIKFEFICGEGNNIYIDDINISDASVGIENELNAAVNFNVFPNPMEENTIVKFELKETQKVKLSIIDLLGREVAVMAQEALNNGEHRFNVSKTALGLNKGVYFIQLNLNNQKMVRKLIVD